MHIRHLGNLLQFHQRLTRYFLSIPWQENLEGPLDRPGTGASNSLPAVIPCLRPVKVDVTAHESTAVFRLILAVAALPGSLQAYVVAIQRSGPLLRRRLGCVS
jgi:hypothetical protein